MAGDVRRLPGRATEERGRGCEAGGQESGHQGQEEGKEEEKGEQGRGSQECGGDSQAGRRIKRKRRFRWRDRPGHGWRGPGDAPDILDNCFKDSLRISRLSCDGSSMLVDRIWVRMESSWAWEL